MTDRLQLEPKALTGSGVGPLPPPGACEFCAACNLCFICTIRGTRENMGPGMQRKRLAAPGMTSTGKGDDFIRAHGRDNREGVINRKRAIRMEV